MPCLTQCIMRHKHRQAAGGSMRHASTPCEDPDVLYLSQNIVYLLCCFYKFRCDVRQQATRRFRKW